MVDFRKLMEQKHQPVEKQLWIGTIQMSKMSRTVRKRDEDEHMYEDVITNTWYVDTTTGSKHPLFAPGWDIVMGHKEWVAAGRPIITPPSDDYVKWLVDWPIPQRTFVDDDFYTAVYLGRMRKSYRQNTDAWVKLLRDAYEGEHSLVLICFCKNGAFCHRYQLKDMLIKICEYHKIPVRDHGEWRV